MRISLRLSSAALAGALSASVAPENPGFVRTERRGNTVYWIVEGDAPGRVRATVDDLMAGLKVAETTLKSLQPPARSKRPKARR